jgi:8-oxo-dGTP diphosphatase
MNPAKAAVASAKKRKTRNPYEYFSVAADIMALRRNGGGYEVLLIQRKNPPYQYRWALPGGFLDRDEDALTAARRELHEETGLRAKKLHEFGSWSAPDRDPRGRCVTISFYTLVSGRGSGAVAGDDAKSLQWFPVSKLPPLAFDHREMIQKGWKIFSANRRKKLSLAQ